VGNSARIKKGFGFVTRGAPLKTEKGAHKEMVNRSARLTKKGGGTLFRASCKLTGSAGNCEEIRLKTNTSSRKIDPELKKKNLHTLRICPNEAGKGYQLFGAEKRGGDDGCD